MRGLIVAVSSDNIIGIDNEIPWHYPLDFKRFKEVTMNSTIIMGRKTWDSIPKKLDIEPLKGRTKFVVSSQPNIDAKFFHPFFSLEAALDAVKTKDVWFIGGSSIYRKALELDVVDVIDMTLIPKVCATLATNQQNIVRFNIFEHNLSHGSYQKISHPYDDSLSIVRMERVIPKLSRLPGFLSRSQKR